MATEEYLEAVTVCKFNEIRENDMRQIAYNDTLKILLIKQNGIISAIGDKCTHYGAPLHTGILGKGHVRCPWHGACFNILTGDIEDFPGLDSLPCYKVDVTADGSVQVSAKKSDLASNKRVKEMTKINACNRKVYLIIGGGPAGAICAETLRQEGFNGRIILACRENTQPYDRVKISKQFDSAINKIQFRTMEFYQNHNIEVWLGGEVISLDTINKRATFKDNSIVDYEKLLIATGMAPVRPPIPGVELTNVFTLRDYSESHSINQLLDVDLNVVCLGSSFIALESAAYMVNKVRSVTVVGRDDLPLKTVFGKEIGERLLRLYEENNVVMKMSSGIEEIHGKYKVTEVKLTDGTLLPCDLLILGVGAKHYTDFLKDSGVNINERGSIDVDMHLRTNAKDVYAAGDVANAPLLSLNNERASIGHFQLAEYHGRLAAINMAGGNKELHAVPFFFTMIFGKGIRYSGYGNFESVVISGDLENFKFVAYFISSEKEKVVGVASCGRDPIVAAFAEMQSQGKVLYSSDVEGDLDPPYWMTKLKE